MISNLQFIFPLLAITCVQICTSPLAVAIESDAKIIERIRQIEKMPRPAYGPDFVKGILIRQLVEQLDPSSYDMAARQLILPGDRSNRTTGYLIPTWIKTDPKEAFEFFKTQDSVWLSYSYTYELMERFAAIDPDGALAAAKSVEVNGKSLIEAVLKVIAAKSPSRALEMLPEEYSSQYGFVGDVITYWAGFAPEEAAKWVMTQPKRGHLLWNLGYMWALENRPDAEKWVKTLDGHDHTFALAGMIEQRANGRQKEPGDPVAATREFMAAFPDTDLDQETLPNQTVKGLASAIARHLHAHGADFNGLEWVQSLKPSPGRENLLSEMIGRWIDKSPKEALPYIQAMEPGKVKETALYHYIRANWKGDPLENFKLSTTLKDQKYRIAIQADVFQQWLLRDPEIAIKSLKSLPDDEETEVKARIASYAKTLKRPVPRES
jgi:hypothetical protein